MPTRSVETPMACMAVAIAAVAAGSTPAIWPMLADWFTLCAISAAVVA